MKTLNLPMSDAEALERLRLKGFKIIDVDILALARKYIGEAQFCRGASLSQAPGIVDCSSFTKWLYGQRGIWLPRRSIQQRRFGVPIKPEEIGAQDLVFTTGFKNYYFEDRADGVGHVGIATGNGTVIHAASETMGITESPIESFTLNIKFRGARRYIPPTCEVVTLECPPGVEVETSDDIRWILLPAVS